MPALKGASSEFIPNQEIPHYPSEIIKLSQLTTDTVLLGHLYGGIFSPAINPFSNNQTEITSADNSIYAVYLISGAPNGVQEINGNNPYTMQVFPNPASTELTVNYILEKEVSVRYFLVNTNGKILKADMILNQFEGENQLIFRFEENLPSQTLLLTFVFDDRFYVTKKIVKK
jgi:hypothetical protein